MSFYTLDRNNQVYGDYIQRLGFVLRQYNDADMESVKYPISLSISLLQSILTVATENILYRKKTILESIEYAEDVEKLQVLTKQITNKPILGIDKSVIPENTFHEHLSIGTILKHLRNAMSHPTFIDKHQSVLKTGFYTLQNDTIEKVIFIDSPDTQRENGTANYKGPPQKFEQFKERQGFPPDSKLIEKKVYVAEKQFYRYMKVELTGRQLIELTLELSSYVSDFIAQADDPRDTVKIYSNKLAA